MRRYSIDRSRLMASAPEAVDLSQETADTQSLYGIDQKETETFGRRCLLSRRLVERGVRFVQLYSGSGSKWDAHKGNEANHSKLCRATLNEGIVCKKLFG